VLPTIQQEYFIFALRVINQRFFVALQKLFIFLNYLLVWFFCNNLGHDVSPNKVKQIFFFCIWAFKWLNINVVDLFFDQLSMLPHWLIKRWQNSKRTVMFRHKANINKFLRKSVLTDRRH